MGLNDDLEWPEFTDSTTGIDGTRVDQAKYDEVKDYIDKRDGAGHALQDPADTTSEVVDARGNLDTLSDRIDGVIDQDGDLIVPDTIETVADHELDISGLSGVNLADNPMFNVIPDTLGLGAGPNGWDDGSYSATWSVAFPTANSMGVATVVTADPEQKVYGQLRLAPSAAGAYARIREALFFSPLGPGFSFCVVVKTAMAGVRAFVTDYNDTQYSSEHPADSSFVLLYTPIMRLGASSTTIQWGLEMENAGTIEMKLPCLGFSRKPCLYFLPPLCRDVTVERTAIGAASGFTGTRRFQFVGPGDGIYMGMWVMAGTASSDKTTTVSLSRLDPPSTWEAVDSVTMNAAATSAGTGAISADMRLRSSRKVPEVLSGDPIAHPYQAGQRWAFEISLGAGSDDPEDLAFGAVFRCYHSPLIEAFTPI